MMNRFIRYGVGIDMSKEFFHACFAGVVAETNEFIIRAQKKFKNTAAGFEQFHKWLQKNWKQEISLSLVMEVTGVYHEELLYFLYEKNYSVSLQQGYRVKNYLKSIGQHSKTDKLDGRGMAKMCCERKLKAWKPASPNMLKIRTLLRHRKAIEKTATAFKNQREAIKSSRFKDQEIVDSLSELIGKMDKEVKYLEKKSVSLAKEDELFFAKVKLIKNSTMGLGYLTLLTVLAETNGLEEFRNQKQLESYAGYDIVENSSGKFSGKTRISKRGNARIRASMYMAALSAARRNSPFHDLYVRLIGRNGGLKKKANVAVQRKMLIIIYTLWKKNEAFDIDIYKAKKCSTDKVGTTVDKDLKCLSVT